MALWEGTSLGGVLGVGWGGGGRKDEMVSDCELGRSAFSAEESRRSRELNPQRGLYRD